MPTLILAMWPLAVALAATAVTAVLERRERINQDINLILDGDFEAWDFEIHVDQALRIANGEDL